MDKCSRTVTTAIFAQVSHLPNLDTLRTNPFQDHQGSVPPPLPRITIQFLPIPMLFVPFPIHKT